MRLSEERYRAHQRRLWRKFLSELLAAVGGLFLLWLFTVLVICWLGRP